jgi:alpha-glucosidase
VLKVCSMDAAFEKDNYIETGMPAEVGELSAGVITGWVNEGGELRFYCDNGCALRIIGIDEKTVRFRFAPDGRFTDDFSYATLPEIKETRHLLVVHEDDEGFLVETGALKISLSREGLRLRIEDLEGNVLSQDEKGFHWYENQEFGGHVVMTSRVIQSREHFYGLGDIPGHKNLGGNAACSGAVMSMAMWLRRIRSTKIFLSSLGYITGKLTESFLIIPSARFLILGKSDRA